MTPASRHCAATQSINLKVAASHTTIDNLSFEYAKAASCLNAQDKDGFLALLDRLKKSSHELDFSELNISAEGMQCMADAFAERLENNTPLGISHLKFCQAKLGSPAPLINALRQHAGGAIESIDFSGAYDQEPAQAGLSSEALTAIAGLPNKNQALRELKLNQQPGLASSLPALTTAVQGSALTTLELRACHLPPDAFQHLKTCIGKSSSLQCIDLRGNDHMASTVDPDPLLVFLRSVNKNKTLLDLHLPEPATGWYEAGLEKVPDDLLKMQLSLQDNTSLRVLTPLSASTNEKLQALNQNLGRNRHRCLQLIASQRLVDGYLRDMFGVPIELRQLVSNLVDRLK